MANPHKGEVDFDADGVTYTIRIKTNELAELEQLYDCSVNEIVGWFSDPDKVKVGTMRAVLWAGLRNHEPRPDIDQTGEIMDAAGLMNIGEKIGEALALTFPADEAETDANPPKGARRGTGKRS